MNTYVVSRVKSENQNHLYSNQSDFTPKDTVTGWTNSAKSFSKANNDIMHSFNVNLEFLKLEIEAGINRSEYVKTALHNLDKRNGFVGGDYIRINRNRKVVASYLAKSNKVRNVYLEEGPDKDNYTIITDQEYPLFSLELADIYWELFDRFQKLGSMYNFELEHFIEGEVPHRIERLKMIPLRRH